MLDGSSVYGREEETDNDTAVFVKYNRMLHGKKTDRGRKRDTLTIKFLKKYIHYAKHRIQPDLTDEVLMLYLFIYKPNIIIYVFPSFGEPFQLVMNLSSQRIIALSGCLPTMNISFFATGI